MKPLNRISKYMSYLLRHNPDGLKMSRDGFVSIDDLLNRIQERSPWFAYSNIEEIVKNDQKGRYELVGNSKIRARYGHSIDVDIDLSLGSIDKLYHGTSEEATQRILKEGLKPMGRQKAHLSRTIEIATEVGRRVTNNPVVLEIDAGKAIGEGVGVWKASEQIFVVDYLPAEYIRILE